MAKTFRPDGLKEEFMRGFSEKIMKTELYRTSVAEYPALFLSETCEIIDVSEKFRSCCADNANRTFLAEVLKDSDHEKLKTFCKDRETDTLLCRMYYLKYRYALAKGVTCGNKRYTVLFLSETVKDMLTLKAYFAGLMPYQTFESYCRGKTSDDGDIFGAFRMLMSPYSYIFVRESTSFLRDLLAKLERRNDLFPYRLTLDENGELPDSDGRIHSGGLSISLVSVIGILGPMSKDGELIFKFDVSDNSFRVMVSTQLLYDIKLRGETENLTGLATHVPGSFTNLFFCELVALETDIRILLKCTESEIAFDVEVPMTSDSILRFNYRDTEELAENVVYLLCSVFTSPILSICDQKKGE